MSIIQTNQPNWFGSEGAPLKNGYIYVGLPNQDPKAFPQTVTFTNAQGNSFAADQPLRTNDAGQIQYNGKPIQASIDTDYSLLILDSNGTQISGGYIPLVEATAGGGSTTDLSAYTENALILADVKQLDVAPGETVRSVGKISADDSLGAFWLVVSNTGNPADDVDLIDFDNGLQGQRVKNYVASNEDNVISDNMIQTDAVTTDKILDDNVTAPKLAETDSERDWVLGRTSVATVGSVGTYALLGELAGGATITVNPGSTRSGGSLSYAGVSDTTGLDLKFSTSPAGTWRCMGFYQVNSPGSGGVSGLSMWLRIS